MWYPKDLDEYITLMFKLFGFPIYGFDRTWWRLFQKCVVHTKFDIYVFILRVSYVHYFYWSAYTKPGKCVVMCLCAMGINFSSFYDFNIWFWNCSDSVVFLVFHVVIEDPTVICRTAIKALLLYFKLCLSVKLDSPSCSFTSISIRTNFFPFTI